MAATARRSLLRSAPGIALAAALVAGPAPAVDLNLGASGGVEYDSNLFGTASEEEGDFALRGSVDAELRDPEGDFTWNVRYAPFYRYFVRVGEASGWSHIVTGNANWRITPTVRVGVRERFARVNNLNFFEDVAFAVDDPVEVPESESRTRRVKRNSIDATLVWDASPLDTVTFGGSNIWREGDEESRGDNLVSRIYGEWLRSVTPRDRLGVTLAVSQNDIENVGQAADRRTRFYNLSLVWTRAVSRTLRFSISAGPTLVDEERVTNQVNQAPVSVFPTRSEGGTTNFVAASTCPTQQGVPFLSSDCGVVGRPLNQAELAVYGPPVTIVTRNSDLDEDEDPRLTYFANASVTKSWETWDLTLAYRRSEATSSTNFGSSTVADVVSLRGQWRASARLTFSSNLAFVRRTQETDSALTAATVTSASIPGCNFAMGGMGLIACGPVQFGTFEDVATPTGLITVRRNLDLVEDQYVAQARASYRLTERLRFNAVASYRLQQFDSDVVNREDRERWRISFGVRYEFDTIKL